VTTENASDKLLWL